MKLKLFVYRFLYLIVSTINTLSFRKFFTGKKIFLGIMVIGIVNSLSSCKRIIPHRTCYDVAPTNGYEQIDSSKAIVNPQDTTQEILCYKTTTPEKQ